MRPAHLIDALRARAAEEPDRVAFRFLDGRGQEPACWTYAELERRATAIGEHLRGLGAGGSPVIVVHPPGLEYIAALFGCWHAGAIAVPAYPPRSARLADRLRSILADSRARLALTLAAEVDRIERPLRRSSGAAEPSSDADGLTSPAWIATDRIAASEPPGQDGARRDDAGPDAIAILQYTSGSTGTPKGVVLPHAAVISNIEAIARRAEITRKDRMVSWLPPYHDMGLVTGILLPVFLGMAVTHLSPAAFIHRPLAWLQAIDRYRTTISGAPNFAYELCVRRTTGRQRSEVDLRSWRIAFVGAERVRVPTLERFTEAFAVSGFEGRALRPCYGLAEATLGVSLGAPGIPMSSMAIDASALGRGRVAPATVDATSVTVVGCGPPLDGCDVAVVDPETTRRRADGEVGEIWVRSPGTGRGYWGQLGVDCDAVFRAQIAGDTGGYLRTGDLGFLRDGELYVTGRIKDLLILSGVNHHPEDIEATVTPSHPALRVAGCAAFSVEADGEERLVVVHELDIARKPSALEVADAVRRAVAGHELMVHELVLVAPGALPKTSSGKVQRGLCRDFYLTGRFTAIAHEPPRAPTPPVSPASPLTDRVRVVMAELLGVEDFSADDDFFGLGGDSLLATQLVSRIRERLGMDVSLHTVFDARSPSRLAARLEQSPARRASEPPVVRVRRDSRVPLSFSQERMWYLHQLDPLGAAYNVAGALSIEGPLDVGAFERALAEVVARHEVLRSNYVTVEGEPRVQIAPTAPFAVARVDLSGDPDGPRRALALASALAAAPFDIARDPLVRVALYRTGTDRHVLTATMHHLVTDAWSMGVMVREAFGHYDALVDGREVPPQAPEEPGYFDYAAWQRERLVDDGLRDDLDYWTQRLAGAEPLSLPTDGPRPLRRSAAGGFEPVNLPTALLASVRSLGVEHGATPFMTFLSAFVLLLHRYTGQTDVVVGVPVANRNRLASEGLVGSLVNMLPVRIGCTSDMTFADLLRRVRDATIGAFSHQDLPFERLIAALHVARIPGESPLVRVMFDYQNAPLQVGRAGGLSLSPLTIVRGASQFDLSLVVLDSELGHLAGVEYSADLYVPATMRRLLGHFVTIVESVVRDSNQRVFEVALLTAGETDELLAWANASFDVGPARDVVCERFRQRAAATPDALAVSDEAGALTYGEVDVRATALASRLRAMGAGPGVRIAVVLERSRHGPVAMLATMMTGAAYVPVDPRYPPARVRFLLADADARIVIAQRDLVATLSIDSDAVVYADDVATAIDAPPAGGHASARCDPSAAAYVLYTSGSTGKPKGVVVTHGALSNFLRSMEREPGMTAADRLLSVTTVAFDIAGLELWLPLVTGARVHVAPGEVVADGARLRELVERLAPSVMQATPATWRLLLEAGWRGDPRLKILCGGEALSRELADELLARSGSLWNMYGPTETTIWSTVHRVAPGAGPILLGRPIDRTRIYVLDPTLSLVPVGVPGEICIGGDGVAQGYLGRPELTEERFVRDRLASEPGARMYRTGDLGRLRPDGLLEHLGRLDHQIKLRGFRIEPGEIEAALAESGLVKEAVVVAREDRPGDARLVAYCTLVDPPGGTATELREALLARLPAHMVPSAFVALASIPRTPNGKVDRAALPAPGRADAATSVEPLAPRDELEEALARVWRQTLGVERIGVRDDFFELGGDSLLAVRLLALAAGETGVDMPLAAFLESPTVENFARRVREVRRANGTAVPQDFEYLVPIQRGRCGPPLFCVHGAGGNVLNMPLIARRLGAERAFCGVQARGVDGAADPHVSIEAMAEAYLREVGRYQPRGPYYLAGYCGGGLVAFEMATRLQASGERVPLLVLMDTYRPGSVPADGPWRRVLRIHRARGAGALAARAGAWAAREGTAGVQRLLIAYHRLLGIPVPHDVRELWLTESFLRAAARYRPGVFRGRITVLRATELDPVLAGANRDLGWSGHATDGLHIHDVPGNHHTIAREPNVAALGQRIADAWTAADLCFAGSRGILA
ncbi:MAG TPA: amino acid adenylation domain-containing protein [Polyangiaceae bacterium]|nr:amino acid adenylation domain-containing protein [Polyangiaceae bacterium]